VIKPVAVLRLIRAVHTVAIQLPRLDARQVAVPYISLPFGHFYLETFAFAFFFVTVKQA
jgi:hypothetical protein